MGNNIGNIEGDVVLNVDDLLRAVNRAGRALDDLEDASNEAERDLDNLGEGAEDMGDDLDDAGRSARNLGDDLDESQGKFADLRRDAKRVGAVAAAAGAVVAAKIGVDSVRAAASFEDAIARAAAKTNNARKSANMFGEAAKIAGQKSTFSAKQAANALQFLAQAGLSAQQGVEALPGVLQLAEASGMELAQASDIATNVLSGFRLEVAELGRVNDVLVAASSKANTGVAELGQAFSFVAPKASAVGMSVEQTAAILGKLADTGIKATRAGRGLRSALMRLQNPPAKAQAVFDELGVSLRDNQGQLRSFINIIQSLVDSGASSQQLAEAFGAVGGTVVEALAPAVGQLQKFRGELNQAGGAAGEQAEFMRKSLGSQLKILSGSIETLQIAMGQKLKPVVEAVAGELTNMANNATAAMDSAKGTSTEVNELAQNSRELTAAMGDLGGALSFLPGDLAGGAAFLSKFYGTGIKATQGLLGLREVSEEAARGLQRYKKAVGLTLNPMEMMSALSLTFRGRMDLLGQQTDEVYEIQQRLNKAVDKYGLESRQAKKIAEELKAAMGRGKKPVLDLTETFDGLASKVRETAEAMLGQKFIQEMSDGWSGFGAKIRKARDELAEFYDEAKKRANQDNSPNIDPKGDPPDLDEDDKDEFGGFRGDFGPDAMKTTEVEAKRRSASAFGLRESGGINNAVPMSEIAGGEEGAENAKKQTDELDEARQHWSKIESSAKETRKQTIDIGSLSDKLGEGVGHAQSMTMSIVDAAGAAESTKRQLRGAFQAAKGISQLTKIMSASNPIMAALSGASALVGGLVSMFKKPDRDRPTPGRTRDSDLGQKQQQRDKRLADWIGEAVGAEMDERDVGETIVVNQNASGSGNSTGLSKQQMRDLYKKLKREQRLNPGGV